MWWDYCPCWLRAFAKNWKSVASTKACESTGANSLINLELLSGVNQGLLTEKKTILVPFGQKFTWWVHEEEEEALCRKLADLIHIVVVCCRFQRLLYSDIGVFGEAWRMNWKSAGCCLLLLKSWRRFCTGNAVLIWKLNLATGRCVKFGW